MSWMSLFLLFSALSLFGDELSVSRGPFRLSSSGHPERLILGRWTPVIGEGRSLQVLYPDYNPKPRAFNALDNPEGDKIWATTPWGLYTSLDGGQQWDKILDRKNIASWSYFTALSVNPFNHEIIALGTSFHGLRLSMDGGKSFRNLSLGLSYLSFGGGDIESITALEFSRKDPHVLYAAYGTRAIILEINIETSEVRNLGFEPFQGSALVHSLEHNIDQGHEILSLQDQQGLWQYKEDSWTFVRTLRNWKGISPQRAGRLITSADRFGIYLAPHQAGDPQRLEAHLDFLEEKGLNAIVVDFKDDHGYLTYNSLLPIAQETGAIRAKINIEDLIERAHRRGIYVIARQVVFKDPVFYRFQNSAYAIWDQTTGRPWGQFRTRTDAEGNEYTYQREHWVDTYAQEVWEYNATIAKELQDRGVDEIQFDYIRTPSDGPVQNAFYRHKKEHMRPVDALESFLMLARQKVDIPISVDVFGYTGWYRMDYLGQDIAVMARYADVISSMFYPSHFPQAFYGTLPYNQKAKEIYYQGSNRTYLLAGGNIHSRPYVQAFLMGPELQKDTPEYQDYLVKQLQGVKESRGNGFLLWNNSNRYYMVPSSLRAYTGLPQFHGEVLD